MLTAITVAVLGVLAVNHAVAQSPAANLVVTVELATNSSHPGTQATMTVNGTGVSLSGSPGPSNSLQYSTNFNETRVITMWPSSYSVSLASVSGYTYTYSTSCFGTMNAGETRNCTVRASNVSGSGSARLIVYTSVINNGGGSSQSGDFTITVSGNNVSPASFRGMSGGTTVTLNPGSYNADVLSITNYNRTRSNDCSGSVSAGETRSCVITLDDVGSVAGAYFAPLTCSPSRQSALVGQTISFVATGGTGSYNWATANRVYLNAGPRVTIMQEGAGTQTVIVTSGHETALCVVDAYASGTYVPPVGQVKGTATGPGLPNTGMGGNLARTIATLVGGLMVAGLFVATLRRGLVAIFAR